MNWIKVVEKYKLAVIRYGNVMYNIMTIVNTAVWYIVKFVNKVNLRVLITRKFFFFSSFFFLLYLFEMVNVS